MRKNIKTFANPTIPAACGVGLGVAVLVDALLILISAICIYNEYFSLDTSRYLAILIQFTGALVGTFIAGKATLGKKAIVCAATAFGIVVIQLCGTLLFFDGVSSGILAQLIAIILGTIGGFLFGLKDKSHYGSKKKRKAYR